MGFFHFMDPLENMVFFAFYLLISGSTVFACLSPTFLQ